MSWILHCRNNHPCAPADRVTPSSRGRGRVWLTCLMMVVASLWVLGGCGTQKARPPKPVSYPKPYKVGKQWYQPIPHAKGFRQKGRASWYGKKFHGRKTSNGETYNMYGISAAHKTLPFDTYVSVHNLDNNRRIDVRINDRGPFVKGRIIDLSYGAAKQLGIVGPGTARVEIVALGARSPTPASGGKGPAYRPMDYYKGNFTFQVGAFADHNNALRLRNKLAKTYKNTHIVHYNDGQTTFYRVRVGRTTTLEAASAYEETLIRNGFTDVFTVAE